MNEVLSVSGVFLLLKLGRQGGIAPVCLFPVSLESSSAPFPFLLNLPCWVTGAWAK